MGVELLGTWQTSAPETLGFDVCFSSCTDVKDGFARISTSFEILQKDVWSVAQAPLDYGPGGVLYEYVKLTFKSYE